MLLPPFLPSALVSPASLLVRGPSRRPRAVAQLGPAIAPLAPLRAEAAHGGAVRAAGSGLEIRRPSGAERAMESDREARPSLPAGARGRPRRCRGAAAACWAAPWLGRFAAAAAGDRPDGPSLLDREDGASSESFWDRTYQVHGEHGREAYEWYAIGFPELKGLLTAKLPPSGDLLVVGAGDSELSAQLAEAPSRGAQTRTDRFSSRVSEQGSAVHQARYGYLLGS
ncbi:unnamed protein product [Prorocentrum cordatum]|uniref:Uncharacterized protein n=1 Tax=Prorocentrum cordatum TaxID=2364126 RepID=A0ABN9S8F5_9DINO|nr:unnamed protein product [Polarella glacialis]